MTDAATNPTLVSSDVLPDFLRRDIETPWCVGGGATSQVNAHGAGAGPVEKRLGIAAGVEPFVVQSGDLLLDVDLALSVSDFETRAARAGYISPLPPFRGTLLEALLAAPALADAIVRDLDGVDRHGGRLSSVAAPRAAVGPDLLGGALMRPLLLLPLRARIRGFPSSRTQLERRACTAASAATATVLDIMREGRAFSVAATKSEVRILFGAVAGDARLQTEAAMGPFPSLPASSTSANDAAPAWGAGVSLMGKAASEINKVLEDDQLLLGFPLQGRLLALSAEVAASVSFLSPDQAATHFAEALRRSGKAHIEELQVASSVGGQHA